jgi:hypothetical protein
MADSDGDGDGDGVGVWIKFLELDEQLTMVENEIEEQEEVIEDLRKEVREAKEEEARIPDEDDYRYGEDAEGKGFNHIAQIQNCCLICNYLTLIVLQ